MERKQMEKQHEVEIDRQLNKMEDEIKEAIERNIELDNQEIARLIAEGNTSGILDNEDGYRISWDLSIEKFEH